MKIWKIDISSTLNSRSLYYDNKNVNYTDNEL